MLILTTLNTTVAFYFKQLETLNETILTRQTSTQTQPNTDRSSDLYCWTHCNQFMDQCSLFNHKYMMHIPPIT